MTVYEDVTHQFFGTVSAGNEAAEPVAPSAERLTASSEDGDESYLPASPLTTRPGTV